MKDPRPVNLDLFSIKFPITAIVSILHRITGAFLFICFPLVLWVLQQSLVSAQTFAQLQTMFWSCRFKQALVWLIISAFMYHVLAGLRHLVMDCGIGESLCAAKLSSYITLGLAIILSIGVGILLWV